MKIINRSKIRNEELDDDCKTANVCREYDNDIEYRFCYGIVDMHYDEYLPKCKKCKACVRNMPDKKDFSRLLNEQDN